jgi:hypothetical protein
MSGYLQRLVARTVNPRGAIHPVVNPRFAPPRFGSQAESMTVEDTEPVAGARPESAAAPVAQPPEVRAESQSPPTPVESRQPAIPAESQPEAPAPRASARPPRPDETETLRDPVQSFQPLVTPALPAASPAPGQSASLAGWPAPLRPGAFAPTRPLNPAAPAPEARQDSAPQPAGGELHHTSEGKPQPLETMRRLAPAGEAQPAPVAPREPDEIQIHIGRIEVTAVPPKPAAPPLKQPRKSLNLAEYLKRGDRRAL